MPPLLTAENVRLWATFEHKARCMRAHEGEQRTSIGGKVGSPPHSLPVRRGCARGQRSSQRADTSEPWAPQATHTLACPTARGEFRVVAVHGRPGHICAQLCAAGSPFYTSGLGGTASNPNAPPVPMHRWIVMAWGSHSRARVNRVFNPSACSWPRPLTPSRTKPTRLFSVKSPCVPSWQVLQVP